MALVTPYARRVSGVHAGGVRGVGGPPKIAPEGGTVTGHEAGRGRGVCAFQSPAGIERRWPCLALVVKIREAGSRLTSLNLEGRMGIEFGNLMALNPLFTAFLQLAYAQRGYHPDSSLISAR